MSLKKTADIGQPHATFVNHRAGWEWRILKVYRAAKTDKGDKYSRWFLAAKSPYTFGEFEMGDTYISDVLSYGQLESATDEFKAYFEELQS
jgi:hypothetical protein